MDGTSGLASARGPPGLSVAQGLCKLSGPVIGGGLGPNFTCILSPRPLREGLPCRPLAPFNHLWPQSPRLRGLRPLRALWLLVYRGSGGLWEQTEREVVTLPTFLGIPTWCCSSDSIGGILWFCTSKAGTLAPISQKSLIPGSRVGDHIIYCSNSGTSVHEREWGFINCCAKTTAISWDHSRQTWDVWWSSLGAVSLGDLLPWARSQPCDIAINSRATGKFLLDVLLQVPW